MGLILDSLSWRKRKIDRNGERERKGDKSSDSLQVFAHNDASSASKLAEQTKQYPAIRLHLKSYELTIMHDFQNSLFQSTHVFGSKLPLEDLTTTMTQHESVLWAP